MLGIGGGWLTDTPGQWGELNRSFTQDDLNKDVVFQNGLQFGLNEGVKGINRQAAAAGSLNSGATLKALTRFGNDYATTKAGDAYNRFSNDQTNKFNRLASLAGVGQTAANSLATTSANTTNALVNNNTSAANARAAGYIGTTNALNSGISNWQNQNQQQSWLDAYKQRNSLY
jgi:hypothetical protein